MARNTEKGGKFSIKDFVDDEMDKVKDEFERLRCKCDEHGHCDCAD